MRGIDQGCCKENGMVKFLEKSNSMYWVGGYYKGISENEMRWIS